MIDAARHAIDIGTALMRSLIVLFSLWAIGKVAIKTSFALVPIIGVVFVAFFVNWAIGNVDWAKSLFTKDAQQLSLPAAPHATGLLPVEPAHAAQPPTDPTTEQEPS